MRKISYASLITFLVFQENTPRKISYAFLIAFLERAFAFQETHTHTPKNKLCDPDCVPSKGFCLTGKHTPKNKLCVSDRVPSKGFCYPGKPPPEKNDPSQKRTPAFSTGGGGAGLTLAAATAAAGTARCRRCRPYLMQATADKIFRRSKRAVLALAASRCARGSSGR